MRRRTPHPWIRRISRDSGCCVEFRAVEDADPAAGEGDALLHEILGDLAEVKRSVEVDARAVVGVDDEPRGPRATNHASRRRVSSRPTPRRR